MSIIATSRLRNRASLLGPVVVGAITQRPHNQADEGITSQMQAKAPTCVRVRNHKLLTPSAPKPCKTEYFSLPINHAFPRRRRLFTGDQLVERQVGDRPAQPAILLL